MIQGLDNFVYLRKDDHKYFDKNGVEYISNSAFRKLFKPHMDVDMIAYQSSKSSDLSPQEIKDEWTFRADEGTRIHEAIQLYNETTTILPENETLRPGILNIESQYKDYWRSINEPVLYDKDVLIATSVDRLLITTSHKNSVIDITDWKTNEKGIKQKEVDKHGKPRNQYMIGVLDHLQNSKYNDYALQLSIEAYFLQKMTGRKIGQLTIHWINPHNPLINYQIPLPYMKLEVEAMIDWYIKDKNKNKSNTEILFG
jgi:hypothetical protein